MTETMMIIIDVGVEGEDATLDDTLLWAAFARRFMAPSAYRLGARVADTLGAQGAAAVAITLRRLSAHLPGPDAFACVEASNILCGEIEEMEMVEAPV